MRSSQTKKITVLAMLSALAFIAVACIRIPAVLFLKYEPKDVVITVGGFLYGPLAALSVSVIVSFIEMVTVSTTGWIGFLMNVISSVAFSCTAAYVYKKKRTISGAVIGMSIGTVLMTVVMLLWNYVLTPVYMDTPRADVAAMLVPVFLPFNLIKGTMNAAITALLYRPLVLSLRRANLLPASTTQAPIRKTGKALFYIFAIVCLALCIVWIVQHNS